MSGCACITVDWEPSGVDDFQTSKMVRARKTHRCGECGRFIKLDHLYERVFGKWDGYISRFITCQGCVDLRRAFFCGPYLYENVIEDVYTHLIETGEPSCCYDGLSPAAMEVMEEVVWPRLGELEEAA